MAKQESAFDVKHIEETAAVEPSGILDELNLPPALIDFLRKYQRKIWTVIGIVAFVVTVVSLYGSYRSYIRNKAAQAYDQALLQDGDAKVAALQAVAEKYSSTPSAAWSTIEIAHLEQADGKIDSAIEKLRSLSNGRKNDDLLKPLLLANIGGLYEQDNKFDDAITVYQELQTLKGFEPEAVNSLGRVYEAMGNKEKAIEMFQQFLVLTNTKETGLQQNDPARIMVQSSLSRLQK